MSKEVIRIKPEEVRATARHFKNKSDESTRMASELSQQWANLKQSWQGATADEVDQKMAAWKKHMQSHAAMLSQINDQLNRLAKEFEEFDAQLKATVKE